MRSSRITFSPVALPRGTLLTTFFGSLSWSASGEPSGLWKLKEPIFWGFPSSVMVKSSGFRSVIGTPLLLVATTSTTTSRVLVRSTVSGCCEPAGALSDCDDGVACGEEAAVNASRKIRIALRIYKVLPSCKNCGDYSTVIEVVVAPIIRLFLSMAPRRSVYFPGFSSRLRLQGKDFVIIFWYSSGGSAAVMVLMSVLTPLAGTPLSE